MELKTKANIYKYFNKYGEVYIDVKKIDSKCEGMQDFLTKMSLKA